MGDLRNIINGGAGIFMIGLLISTIWWSFGIFAFIGIGVMMGVLNILFEDYNKDRRLERLEDEIKRLKK